MPSLINQLMEQASEALARMQYLACESLCLAALAGARQAQQWDDYARILMPLQECRRQRRMIAADGMTRLGAAAHNGDVMALLDEHPAACIVLTHPHTAAQAATLASEARDRQLHVEVLYADNAPQAERWTLRWGGVSCDAAAPPEAWIDRWMDVGTRIDGKSAADWFIDATEALGDAALAQVKAVSDLDRLEQLEHCLRVVTDHEILHQRLGDAARALGKRTR